jgi:hypothetical protein
MGRRKSPFNALYMKIFSMDNDSFEISLDPEVLLIKEFKDIVKRDRSVGKIVSMAELSYVWFFADFKSDFGQIIDEKERTEEIMLAVVGLPKKWVPDDVVKAAVVRYRKLSESVASRLLIDAMTTVNNLSKYAKEASGELSKMDGEKPQHDVSKILAFIDKLPNTLSTIKKLEEEVVRERNVGSRHRGTQDAGMFENEDE